MFSVAISILSDEVNLLCVLHFASLQWIQFFKGIVMDEIVGQFPIAQMVPEACCPSDVSLVTLRPRPWQLVTLTLIQESTATSPRKEVAVLLSLQILLRELQRIIEWTEELPTKPIELREFAEWLRVHQRAGGDSPPDVAPAPIAAT